MIVPGRRDEESLVVAFGRRAIAAGRGGGSLEALRDARFISVTTFRRSGEGVATPVEFVARDGAIYVRTLADSGTGTCGRTCCWRTHSRTSSSA
jgi:hypothetical protein